jgi:hypothetical protein
VSRSDRITHALMRARKVGVVSDWIVGSPAGRTRWNVWGPGWERTFSTAEVEAFLCGVNAVDGQLAHLRDEVNYLATGEEAKP